MSDCRGCDGTCCTGIGSDPCTCTPREDEEDDREELLANLRKSQRAVRLLIDSHRYAEALDATVRQVRVSVDQDPSLELFAGEDPTGYAQGWAAAMAVIESVLDAAPCNGEHVYLSTGCFHGDLRLPDGRTGHEYCQSDTGHAGSKIPGQCKFCATPCICWCHYGPPPDDCPQCGNTGACAGGPCAISIPLGASAEDCPRCEGTNPPYPFICPGHPAIAKEPTESHQHATGGNP